MNTHAPTMMRNLFAGVNKPTGPQNLTDLERKHIPVINAPAQVKSEEYFEICVHVGKLLEHPNERSHFIEFIDVYADELFLARVDLTAVNTSPKVTLSLALSEAAHELRAYARCNMHGVWIGTSPIEVS